MWEHAQTEQKWFLGVFVIALAWGLGLDESIAHAYSGNGLGDFVCGSADIDPATGQPKLPSGDWISDCNDLAADCSRSGCDYTPGGFGGGSCHCH